MSTPPTRALVVIDVQNEYFPGGGLPIEHPPVATSLPNILRAMDAARAAGIAVVVVQHRAPQGAPIFQADQPGGQLHADVASRHRDHLVTKAQASVFAGTDFGQWLVDHAIDTLTVAGYMTHNCDASTVLEAAHRNLAVEFLADATGALPYENAAGHASAEEIHRVFSVVLHSNFAAVASTDEWLAAVQQRAALPKDNIVLSNRRGRERAVHTV